VVPEKGSPIVDAAGNRRVAVFGWFIGVLVGLPIAEVDGRCVAHAPWRIAGKHVGLAFQKGRETALDAGHQWQSWRISGGPKTSPRASAMGQVRGTCRWKASWAAGAGELDGSMAEVVLAFSGTGGTPRGKGW